MRSVLSGVGRVVAALGVPCLAMCHTDRAEESAAIAPPAPLSSPASPAPADVQAAALPESARVDPALGRPRNQLLAMQTAPGSVLEVSLSSVCDGGDAAVCYQLAQRYHGGDGVPRDDARVLGLVHRACAMGHAPACYDLAARHLVGMHSEVDVGEAFGFAEQACSAGIGDGCFLMGRILDGAAEEFLVEAHEHGGEAYYDDDAPALAGVHLEEGEVERAVTPDAQGALAAYLTGCRLESTSACEVLFDRSSRREVGREAALPPESPVRQIRFARLCDAGVESACAALDRALVSTARELGAGGASPVAPEPGSTSRQP